MAHIITEVNKINGYEPGCYLTDEQREQVLAKGKESYAKLVEKVKWLDFDKAYTELGGWNLENNEFFDCDFESITATIYRNEDGTSRVGDCYEAWDDEVLDYVVVEVEE